MNEPIAWLTIDELDEYEQFRTVQRVHEQEIQKLREDIRAWVATGKRPGA